ncbi:MAG: OmpA family protein [Sandaracinaceae bacterium]
MKSSSDRAGGAWLVAVMLLVASPAQAQETLLFSVEGAFAVSPVDPQRAWFGPGGNVGARFHAALSDALLLGVGVDAIVLTDGDPPGVEGAGDPGATGIFSLEGSLRVRPLPFVDAGAARGTGLFLDLGVGAALTGELLRPTASLTAGWGFAAGDVDIGPFARWRTVFELDNQLESSPAHVLSIGVALTFLDARDAAAPAPSAPLVRAPSPSDRDWDGLVDASDGCPDEPEDVDSFQDDDGCPDLDNDGDGFPDFTDGCPMQPEDEDGYYDEDGCPDPDNDSDGIADDADHCPLEAERVNGIDDEDGCPDYGLVELIHDHVILEESVLFEFGASTLRAEALPSLQALAELVHQHPEWSRVRVEGHACAQGDHAVNQRLSEARAEHVRAALVEAGIAPDMIDAMGHGEESPRGWGDTEDIHALNRRVEFVVVERREVHTVHSPAREGGSTVEVRRVLRTGEEQGQ